MKITCTQENLNHALNQVTRIVNQRASLPVLSNILISAEKDRIKIASTDLEIGICFWIGGKIEEKGAITVPAKIISEFVSTCTDKNLKLISKGTELKIESVTYKAQITGIDADEFPLIPEINEKPIAIIKTKTLKTAIPQVLPAVSLDESRPVLTGVYWQFKEGNIILAATDSYRLAEKTITPVKSQKQEPIIVPFKTMSEIERMLSQTSAEEIEISIAENQIRVLIGDNCEIISRLIEGAYPDYLQILPKSFKINTKVDKNELNNGLKMASLFARESANNINIDFKKDLIEIAAEAAQVGNIDSKIKVQAEGEETKVSFNVKFFSDGLSVIESDVIYIEVSGSSTPIKITDPNSKDFFYILMPLRTE